VVAGRTLEAMRTEPSRASSPSSWPPPTGTPVGSTGWFRASDGEWYRSDDPPAPGYRLGADGRWEADDDPDSAWRSSRWGLGDVWWGIAVYVIAGVVLGLVAALVYSSRGESLDEIEFGVYTISLLVLANALAFAGIPWLATHRKGLRSLRWDFGLWIRPRDLAIGLGLGFAGLVTAALVGTAIDVALGADETTSNVPIDDLVGPGEIIAFSLAVAVLTPIIEELFFRGLLYRSFLKRGRSAWTAIGLTTTVFVIPHLTAADSPAALVSLTASLGVLGFTFNLACHLTGNRLGSAIVAHMVVNSTAVVALALG
jgi:uncharacterized protein